jgi:hypothetical protein
LNAIGIRRICGHPMTIRASARPSFVAVLVLASCTTAPPAFPPGPSGVQEISVAEPSNRTGRDLVVEDPGMLGRYFGDERSTAPQVLARDLRALLEDRRFRVVRGTAEGVPRLQIELRRWDPYSVDYSQVTVSLRATLVDPSSGRTLWTADRTDWKVKTASARTQPEAFTMASLEIARALLEGWQPGGSAPSAGR